MMMVTAPAVDSPCAKTLPLVSGFATGRTQMIKDARSREHLSYSLLHCRAILHTCAVYHAFCSPVQG